MSLDVEKVIVELLSSSYFEKAKKVREVSAGHTEDSVYTHCVQTLEEARKSIDGNFITNPEAKERFTKLMTTEIDGVPYRDLALIVALTHDVGKILSFEEGSKIYPMNIQKPGTDIGTTYNPGHEYWGSTLIPDLLKNTGLPEVVIKHIANVVRLHGHIFVYYSSLSLLPLTDTVKTVKSYMEGAHVEALFNSYCDTAHNKPQQPCRELIVKILNDPSAYVTRDYLIK